MSPNTAKVGTIGVQRLYKRSPITHPVGVRPSHLVREQTHVPRGRPSGRPLRVNCSSSALLPWRDRQQQVHSGDSNRPRRGPITPDRFLIEVSSRSVAIITPIPWFLRKSGEVRPGPFCKAGRVTFSSPRTGHAGAASRTFHGRTSSAL